MPSVIDGSRARPCSLRSNQTKTFHVPCLTASFSCAPRARGTL